MCEGGKRSSLLSGPLDARPGPGPVLITDLQHLAFNHTPSAYGVQKDFTTMQLCSYIYVIRLDVMVNVLNFHYKVQKFQFMQ